MQVLKNPRQHTDVGYRLKSEHERRLAKAQAAEEEAEVDSSDD